MLFAQHWYWYPMLNFLNLALTPTAIIGINDKLKVPKSFKSISNAKPSMYKYPEMLKVDDNKKKEKVTVAVLSTTDKAKARKARKDGKNPDEPTTPKLKDAEMTNEETKKEGEEDKDKKEEDKKDEPEPDFQELKNPSRVLK